MKRLAFLLMLAPSLAWAGTSEPLSPDSESSGGGGAHPSDTTLALDDDVSLTLGGDSDFVLDFDSAANDFEINHTTNGKVLYLDDTGRLYIRGNNLYFGGGGTNTSTNTRITSLNDEIWLTVNSSAKLKALAAEVSLFVPLAIHSATVDPCSSVSEGAMFYNTTSNYMCYCDGTNDVQVHDPATACF